MQTPLTIALVNNAPDSGMPATARHFCKALHEGANGKFDLRIDHFTCRDPGRVEGLGVPEGTAYAGIDDLFMAHVDGVVVTGMEPQAGAIQDEPLWPSLTRVVDWAAENQVPVIWSCLAAHAAVYHLSGISRRRLPSKLSGIFACEAVLADDPVLTGLPERWRSPHSRHNDLPDTALHDNAYQILSCSAEAGVDLFAYRIGVNFLFCQGHPEYDGETLIREYRRDLRRFLLRESLHHPVIPRYYLDARTEAALEDLREAATQGHDGNIILQSVSRVIQQVQFLAPWQRVATALYANWLCQIAGTGRRPRQEMKVRPVHGMHYEPRQAETVLVR